VPWKPGHDIQALVLDMTTVPSRRRNLFEASDQVMRSVSFSYAQRTSQDFAKLFDGSKVYDNPKDPADIRRLVEYLTGPNDLIVDLFSGSGTTAHAVMLSNAAGRGSRRYLCVQLPEPLDGTRNTGKAAIKLCRKIGAETTVFSLGLERARRAGKLCLDAGPDIDAGFRVFRLSDSNIRPWTAGFENLDESLLDAIDNVRPERSQEDVLYELVLKYGLEMSIRVEERNISGSRVFLIGFGALVVCFEAGIGPGLIDGIVAIKRELNPAVMRVVFRDACFADDVGKTNAFQALRQAGIADVRSL